MNHQHPKVTNTTAAIFAGVHGNVPVLRKTATAGRLSRANASLLMQAVGVTLHLVLKLKTPYT